MRHTLVSALITLCLCATSFAADPPVNTWTPLGDGAFKLPATGYPSLSGSKFMWLADRDGGIVAPLLTEHPVDYGVWMITHKEPAWKFTPTSLPEGFRPDLWESQLGYVYLPTLKKVLVVRQQWGYQSSKKPPVSGWLVDPVTADWQPITGEVWMCDKSKDFNPSAGRDGLRLPIWGKRGLRPGERRGGDLRRRRDMGAGGQGEGERRAARLDL